MKFLVVFASLLVAISAVSDEQAWADFKQTYSREYKSFREEKLRFQVFKSNLQTINEHNARYENGEESYTLGVNQFTDLTEEEFKDQYLSLSKPELSFTESFEVPERFTAPESVDWRTKGAVLSVKDQKSCGSCWAFSAIGALEGQNAIKHNITTDLSEQELLDCSNDVYGNSACHGGLMTKAFNYLKDNGIATLESYPYVGRNTTCSRTSHPRSSVKVTGYKNVAAAESALEAAVASVGPISIGIVGRKIQLYSKGIFDNAQCGFQLDHGVLAVGYGEEDNKQYWIVKNSWGAKWGENGYIRMSRNKSNQCGISSLASYPLIA